MRPIAISSALAATGGDWPRPLLYSDRGCPFAHRVRALLAHLGVAHDHRDSPPGELPAELLRWSPSGRVPLLVHGDVAIGESRVMLEHLAEAYRFEAAYPDDLAARTRHRHAMALLDVFLVPQVLGRGELGAGRLAECLDVLEGAAAEPPAPSLHAFHVAPMWLRLQWWHPQGALTRAIGDRPVLRAWLDGVAALAAVVATGQSPAEALEDYRAAVASSCRPG